MVTVSSDWKHDFMNETAHEWEASASSEQLSKLIDVLHQYVSLWFTEIVISIPHDKGTIQALKKARF